MGLMLWIGALSLASWAALLAFRGGFWRTRPAALPPFPERAPDIGIVVPARNEEGLVGRAVASLAAQKYPGPIRLYVVDDHSGDGTSAEAIAAGAEVIPSRPLPSGWTGKMWAVSQGIERAATARPAFLVLTDADVVHSPGTLAGLVAQAERGGYDLVSLMVKLHCRSLAERALIPAFVFFFLKLYPPSWVADPKRRTAGAAGGCILIRAEALERIGGMAAIRGELIDDCALAAAVKRSGGRVWLGLAADSHSIRTYGPGDVDRMIARTAFTQLRHSVVLLAATVAGMSLIYIAPPVLTFAKSGPARWLGISAWTMMSAAYLPMLRYYSRSPLWAPALPGVAAFYVAATIKSALRHWRGAGGEWKGRVQRTG